MPTEEKIERRFDSGRLLGRFVARYWGWIIFAWLLAAIFARTLAPSWDEIAYDGDFEYLPSEMPSVAGGKLLDAAFPKERSRSQILILVAREEALKKGDETGAAGGNGDQTQAEEAQSTITPADQYASLDLTRRLYHRLAEASIARAMRAGWQPGTPPESADIKVFIDRALLALNEAISADEIYYEYFVDRLPEIEKQIDESQLTWPRLAIAYWDRAYVHRLLGNMEQAEEDALIAIQLAPQVQQSVSITERDISGWESLLDVLTWYDKAIGHRLKPRTARIIALRLSSELAATGNIATLNRIEDLIAQFWKHNHTFIEPGLKVIPTGTAAIGGETLRASADAIRYTELLTVILILAILAVIYRSPLLVAIPIISIGVAVVCATGLVAVLASSSNVPGLSWLDLKIFTTSRIFVVVILFGAGTDYCLFLISRLREEASQNAWGVAVEKSLARVSDALIGSAMTTVVGLAMLWVADFGKFHYSGPVIAICLLVALAVCTTLTPALLMAFGPKVFWPARIPTNVSAVQSKLWHEIAGVMTRRPVIVLTCGLGLLVPPAIYGFLQESRVTYDISSELGPTAVSRQGIELLRTNLSLGEANPITLLLVREQAIEKEELEQEVRELANGLYKINGVTAVRHATDPLGDYPPGTQSSLFDKMSWRRRALQTHRISQQFFWSDVQQYRDRLVRLDVVTASDPFQRSSAEELRKIQDFVDQVTAAPDSVWSSESFAIVGTVPSITDLRFVTGNDAIKIKIWVVVAVLIVLVLVLRRFGLSLYMILTVLISYYATLGVTAVFFQFVYGDTYVGLDWKVPIFLFVILVAVGQDYNVYLVTRILEEQKSSHPLAAVRRAVARTGGIITSCGVVMAGTFFSMTASAWVPGLLTTLGFEGQEATGTLRGITELGFALGFGVLLDTFYVRTVLVPAFCVLRNATSSSSQSETSEPQVS